MEFTKTKKPGIERHRKMEETEKGYKARLWKELCREWRIVTLIELGNKCCKCGFDDVRALQIDHIHGGGTKETSSMSTVAFYKKVIKEKGVNYQLLCANCNWIKRCENNETKGYLSKH